jgi:hypothetical protein
LALLTKSKIYDYLEKHLWYDKGITDCIKQAMRKTEIPWKNFRIVLRHKK